MNTTKMNEELRTELVRLGWKNPDSMIWGRRVSGDMHGAKLEFDGVVKYYAGPFSSVRGGDQIAIVRWN